MYGDHPRSRGEYPDPDSGIPRVVGSSPLSRGIPYRARLGLSAPGIIPALAGNTGTARRLGGSPGDHPRSRGEYMLPAWSDSADVGSSPLSRGIREGDATLGSTPGIIPALAGNTRASAVTAAVWRDHPRSRGEYASGTWYRYPPLGSSPLSRGIRGLRLYGRRGVGIIPALAGNTQHGLLKAYATSDHPRSRGEYTTDVGTVLENWGSSPLSRGILHSLFNNAYHMRIIPALAGNTPRRVIEGDYLTDHPRSRGEYASVGDGVFRASGSSPLSRGILGLRTRAAGPPRIIPALAGNTRTAPGRTVTRRDHPRSRGEYDVVAERERGAVGSSPLSRGIRFRAEFHPGGERIIPALAGNTSCCSFFGSVRGDHPRSRGEYEGAKHVTPHHRGSSPLSRGIHDMRAAGKADRGIIPALAGNTCGRFPRLNGGPDHPRSRGEYVLHHPSQKLLARIIPALAGNTGAASRDQAKAWDHPRSRGEYMSALRTTREVTGSSPLSRGIRRPTGCRCVRMRIIPALAGNTGTEVRYCREVQDHPRSRGEYFWVLWGPC